VPVRAFVLKEMEGTTMHYSTRIPPGWLVPVLFLFGCGNSEPASPGVEKGQVVWSTREYPTLADNQNKTEDGGGRGIIHQFPEQLAGSHHLIR
jgi:hypothetical protein